AMPSLRDRVEDIPLLALYFCARFSKRMGRHVQGLSAEARSSLLSYSWPGNVRELENAIEHAVVIGSSPLIRPADLPQSRIETSLAKQAESSQSYHGVVTTFKKKVVVDALAQSGGNVTEAARILDLHPNYLHRLIRNLEVR